MGMDVPTNRDSTTDERLSRRDVLKWTAAASASAACGSLARHATATDVSPVSGFGSAKRCILIYLWGSPSQLETFDPKPNAPPEIQGEFRSIESVVPGVRIGEILPRLSRLLDRVTVLRSLTHDFPIHGTAFATTSVPSTDVQLEGSTRDPRHWPYIGSVVD